MKKIVRIFFITMIILGYSISPILTFAEATTETIDTWMPDKNLQKAVAEQYGVQVNQLTKSLLEEQYSNYCSLNLTDNPEATNDEENGYFVQNLEGLQYINGNNRVNLALYYTTNTAMSVNLSYYLNVKDDRYKKHGIYLINYNEKFTNFGLFWEYLNSKTANYYTGFSLKDDYISRECDLQLSTSIDNLQTIRVSIPDFYQKGTDYGKGTFLNLKAQKIEEDTSYPDYENGFLNYVYITQNDIKLIYSVYLDEDSLVFKLNDLAEDYSQIDRSSLLHTSFDFEHVNDTILTRSIPSTNGYYFQTKVNLDISIDESLYEKRSVTAHYEDENGQSIFDNVVLAGNEGEAYITEQKDITGYTFKEMKENSAGSTGLFTATPQEVTYVYSKNTSVSEGSVTAHYEDENGQSISDNVVLAGNEGEAYTTEQKDITGYTFKEMKENSAGSTGLFTATPQEVTYVYTKNVSPVKPVKPDLLPKKNVGKTTPTHSTNKLPQTGETHSLLLTVIGSMILLIIGVYALNPPKIDNL